MVLILYFHALIWTSLISQESRYFTQVQSIACSSSKAYIIKKTAPMCSSQWLAKWISLFFLLAWSEQKRVRLCLDFCVVNPIVEEINSIWTVPGTVHSTCMIWLTHFLSILNTGWNIMHSVTEKTHFKFAVHYSLYFGNFYKQNDRWCYVA